MIELVVGLLLVGAAVVILLGRWERKHAAEFEVPAGHEQIGVRR